MSSESWLDGAPSIFGASSGLERRDWTNFPLEGRISVFTSSVDRLADKLIQVSFAKRWITVLFLTIAHRLSTFSDYDRIMVLIISRSDFFWPLKDDKGWLIIISMKKLTKRSNLGSVFWLLFWVIKGQIMSLARKNIRRFFHGLEQLL